MSNTRANIANCSIIAAANNTTAVVDPTRCASKDVESRIRFLCWEILVRRDWKGLVSLTLDQATDHVRGILAIDPWGGREWLKLRVEGTLKEMRDRGLVRQYGETWIW